MMIELKSSEKRKAKALLAKESSKETSMSMISSHRPLLFFEHLPGFIMSLETLRTAEEASGSII